MVSILKLNSELINVLKQVCNNRKTSLITFFDSILKLK